MAGDEQKKKLGEWPVSCPSVPRPEPVPCSEPVPRLEPVPCSEPVPRTSVPRPEPVFCSCSARACPAPNPRPALPRRRILTLPARHVLGDLGPAVAQLGVQHADLDVFVRCPRELVDVRVQMVVPPGLSPNTRAPMQNHMSGSRPRSAPALGPRA